MPGRKVTDRAVLVLLSDFKGWVLSYLKVCLIYNFITNFQLFLILRLIATIAKSSVLYCCISTSTDDRYNRRTL